MDLEELQQVHNTYNDNIRDWAFWGLAYSGGRVFIEYALKKHTRESDTNWKSRQEEGINFNYAAIVIDLFNFYLTEKPALRDLGSLVKDPLWIKFTKDSDLYGTNFDAFLNEAQKLAAIYGAVGILVDKPNSENTVMKQDVDAGIYPYCATYTLPNILDWKHERDPITNRPTLVYLKLLDEDGRYILWWPDKWEIWTIPENSTYTGFSIHKHKDTSNYKPKPGDNKYANEPGTPQSALVSKEEPILIAEGLNPLGEIPFLWFQNIKSIMNKYIGESDIKEIARITASVIRNISYGEEVIKFAGFPQARRPMAREGEEVNNDAGVMGILEFDPTMPESKPDWLKSEVGEPIDAIMNWIEKKIQQIFQLAHLSGIHGQATSVSSPRSGVALRYEYQQLGLVLGKKSENVTETELGIIKLWLKWQGKEKDFDNVEVSRSSDFSIDDLSQSLENSIMADRLIPEINFKKALMKMVAKKSLPDAPDDLIIKIHDAIDKLTEEQITASKNPTDNRSTKDIRQGMSQGMVNYVKGSSRQLDGTDSRGEDPDR